jgi:atypical dual specificity phosphatase
VPTIDWLQKMVTFIDTQRKQGLTVYVHCRNGASRSGLVVIAYIMFKNNWTREEALAFVHSKRDVTRPNPLFLNLLLEWEEELQGKQAAATGK